MGQSCLVCGPDVDCAGHPARKVKPRAAVEKVTPGKCPICEHMDNKPDRRKHSLGGYYQVRRALTFGPVLCLSRKGVKKGDPAIESIVHGVRMKDGALQLDTLAGWAEDFDHIWALCSPEPYKDAGL